MLFPVIPQEVAPAAYFLCVGLAVVIVGIAKAGFGGGIGILAIPVMALVMPPQQMLGIMLPVLIMADILSNLHHFGHWDWSRLRPLLFGAVLGVVLGTVTFYLMRDVGELAFTRSLQVLVGVICLTVVAMQAYRLTGRELPTLPPHPASGATVGLVAGFVSTLSHSAGPIVSIYLLQEKLPKRVLVSTMLMYFLIINAVKVPTYVAMDMINARSLLNSVWFLPLLPVGTFAGAWMNKRIPEKPFAAIMYVAAGVTAGHLIYRSMMT